MSMSTADYREFYDDACRKFVEARKNLDHWQRRRAVEWEIIEASRHGVRGRVLDTDTYIEHKIKLGNIEGALEKAQRAFDLHSRIWERLRPPRKRRTVLVDGVRTKLEFA